MSNDLTSTPLLWVVDSPGILSETPVYITKIYYLPGTQAHTLIFKQWNENSTVAAGSLNGKEGTITSAKTLTSTGNLPSSIADGHIFEITYSNGDQDNLGKKLVEAAGNGNAITITEDDWENEASIMYNWRTFATVPAAYLIANSGNTDAVELDFGYKGRRFPNLTLETIGSGSAYIYLSRY